MKTLLFLVFLYQSQKILCDNEDPPRLEIICPPFHNESERTANLTAKEFKVVSLESGTKYCTCTLHVTKSGRTAIVKCDFYGEQNILLTGNLLNFGEHQASSAYVRMTNSTSALVEPSFFTSWMDAPSSALDLWYCGKVTIKTPSRETKVKVFPELKTFVGIGIIECTLPEIPANLLRDRSRGALRIKTCNVERIREGILHNVDEVRYLVMEDSVIGSIDGSLSSNGVICLSKKTMHSWDGFLMMNTTIKSVAPNAFNITHKSDMEYFAITQSRIGKLGKRSLNINGDVDVVLSRNTFSELDSYAIQTSVTGKIKFFDNTIGVFKSDAFHGLQCEDDGSKIRKFVNNSFGVANMELKELLVPFKEKCGKIEVNFYQIKEQPQSEPQVQSSKTVNTTVALVALVVCLAVFGAIFWAYRNKHLMHYRYKRSDSPLMKEDGRSAEELTSVP